MKALRAMLGAVAFMTVAVVVYLFTISYPKVIVVDQSYALNEEEDYHSFSHPLPSHTTISKDPQSPQSSSLKPPQPITDLHDTSSAPPSLSSSSFSSSSLSSSTAVSTTEATPPPVLYDNEMMGRLNFDIWRQPAGYLVDDLRIRRDFPSHPEVRRSIDKLQTMFNAVDKDSLINKFGCKIYGYLLPRASGPHMLRARLEEVTAACGMEVWLSSGPSPLHTRLIASAQTDMQGRKERGVVEEVKDSKSIYLDQSTAYYFEFLEKAFDGKCIASLLWKEPGEASFSAIPPENFAMAVKLLEDGPSEYLDGWTVANELLKELPSNKLQSHDRVEYIGDTVYPISEVDVLEPCQFLSDVAYPHKLKKQYEGVYTIRESLVYPKDTTVFSNWRKHDKGSRVLSDERRDKVLGLYKKTFHDKGYKGDVRVRMMEETENKKAGSRFLLELDVELEGSDVIHTSEYAYLASGSDSSLCHTTNFQWKRDAFVYIVVSVKNLGVWVQHLIRNMEHLYKVTRDENFELVIADYQSADVDIESQLKASSLPRWKVISLSGSFSRSGGLQAGLDYVTDPNSIVMTVDMHLTLPPGLVEYIRRHVVRGMMGFAPMFFRLNQGFTEININGFWETLTYGLLGMYKSDWDNTGGFDTQKYTTKWGGEDWDAVDKIVSHGLELFRVRYPGLVHYFHTRAGLWTKNVKR